MRRVLVVGPIALDLPVVVPRVPDAGEFVQGRMEGWVVGGTGANVARALVTRVPGVMMVGYVGSDAAGEANLRDLRERAVDTTYVQVLRGNTSQVLIMVDNTGERTIVGLTEDELGSVTLPRNAILGTDVLFLGSWRPGFEHSVGALGHVCTLVCVPFPEPSAPVPARVVVGSAGEMPETSDPWGRYRDWTAGYLEALIVTKGAAGVRVYQGREDYEDHAGIPVRAIDSTGAGDAFAAALLTSIVDNEPLEQGIREGLIWGAAAAASTGSVPPPWDQVDAVLKAAQPG